MRTARYVATVSTVVLAFTVMVASIARELVGSLNSDAVLSAFGEAALGAVFLGALAWLGTYLGARFSTPNERSDRLTRVLSLTFIAVGVLLSLPFQTHALKLDMPSASYARSGVDWSAVLLPLGLLALVVVIPFAITRVLAIALAKVVRP